MPREIQNVTVIGTGQIGHGVAQLFAQNDFDVNLVSRKEETLQEAIKKIRFNLELVTKEGLLTKSNPERALSRIRPRTMADLSKTVEDTDFVVEAVIEDLALKQRLFRDVDKWSPAHTILATSTSGLSVTKIGRATKRPKKFVGTHFLGRPHLMPIVEVVRGDDTSLSTFRTTCDLITKIGKHPIAVKKEIPGFILNRLEHAMWREAISLLQKKAASAEDIDKTVTMGFGLRHPVIGPLELMDVVGLDLVEAIHSYLLRDLDKSSRPLKLLRDDVRKGYLGAKSGRGFYEWPDGREKERLLKLDLELINRLKIIAKEESSQQ